MSADRAVAFRLAEPPAALRDRWLLDRRVPDFLARELAAAGTVDPATARWTVDLGPGLLFDREGLALIARALLAHRGDEAALRLALRVDAATWTEFYSLRGPEPVPVELPLVARRAVAEKAATPAAEPTATVVIDLPADAVAIPFPAALRAPGTAPLPRALLLPGRGDFDLLFANHIALVTALTRAVRASPRAWLGALRPRRGLPWRTRAALAFTRIAADAQVHPTAVVEASVIGPGARIGAHCVVRYSLVGAGARLHDGAKVEHSVVGPGSWLMHDLVLYRCQVEDEVFLIHGPYQFSQFQSRSAAFATILMDYRPDGRPIRVATADGPRDYHGRFLGCVLKPGAKTLGGSLVAPGRIIAEDTWLGCDPAAIHLADPDGAIRSKALPPSATARPKPS
jgi:hypothetical protein